MAVRGHARCRTLCGSAWWSLVLTADLRVYAGRNSASDAQWQSSTLIRAVWGGGGTGYRSAPTRDETDADAEAAWEAEAEDAAVGRKSKSKNKKSRRDRERQSGGGRRTAVESEN